MEKKILLTGVLLETGTFPRQNLIQQLSTSHSERMNFVAFTMEHRINGTIMSTNHVLQCHIYTALEHLQEGDSLGSLVQCITALSEKENWQFQGSHE